MSDTKIRAVMFDMDGTLLNTLADIANSINSILQQHGFSTHRADSYRLMVGAGLRLTVEQAIEAGEGENNGQVTDQLIDLMVAEVQTAYAADPTSRTRLYDGIAGMLTALEDRGIPMAVLSNKPDGLVQLVAREFLGPWNFRRILGARDGSPKKPDPTTALGLAGHLETHPTDILLLGDSEIDMMTARRAGMLAVGALWGFRDADELWSTGARVVVTHPEEVLSLVNGR
ncbi:MAG: HAD family hydrolase [Spirochaetia bacterium]